MRLVFPETFIDGLIVGALVLVSVSVVALLGMMLRDYLKGRLW
jgi:hypothetical protein